MTNDPQTLPFDPPGNGDWFEWEERAVFQVTGPDRVRFLNGQVSNDLSRDLRDRTIAACLCSLKGKVDALVWITERDGALLVDGEGTQREQIHDRLERYLIADDCEIEDCSGQLRLFHRFQEDPSPGNDSDGAGRESWRLGLRGEDHWIADGEEAPGWDPARRLGGEEIERLALFSLLPRSGTEINGEEFPSELGLDRWAVDFQKGCYLGQEIVSRIHSVGRDRKSLALLQTDFPTEAGMELRDREDRVACVLRPSEKKIGRFHYSSGDVFRAGKSSQSTEEQPLNRGFSIVGAQLKRPI